MGKKAWNWERVVSLLQATVRRFPLPLVAAASTSMFMMIGIHLDGDGGWTSRGIIGSILAFLLLLSVSLLHENKRVSRNTFIGLVALVAVLVAGFVSYIPVGFDGWYDMHLGRTFLWMGSAVMLLFLAPFSGVKKNMSAALWVHGTQAVIGAIVAYVLAVILFAGLAAAIGAVDVLFSFDLNEELYGYTAALVYAFIAPLIFVSRIATPDELQQQPVVGRELKIAAYGILLPLTIIYFAILFLYAAVELPGGGWPEVTISYMIVGFSVVGVLAHALLYPMVQKERWLHMGTRILYAGIALQSLVLFWSVGVRVNAFGWTDNRVLVVVFGVWLLAVSIYMLVRKEREFRLIPASLFVVMVVFGSFGPWSALSIGQSSQTARLDAVIEEAGLRGENGFVDMEGVELTDEQKETLRSVTNYLVDTHGPLVMQPYTDFDLSAYDGQYPYEARGNTGEAVFGSGIDWDAYSGTVLQNDTYYSFYADESQGGTGAAIGEYDYAVNVASYFEGGSRAWTLGDRTVELVPALKDKELRIEDGDGETLGAIDLLEIAEHIQANGELPRGGAFGEHRGTVENDLLSAQLVVTSFSGMIDGGVPEIHEVAGLVFISLK